MNCSHGSLSHRYRDNQFEISLMLHRESTAFFDESFAAGYDNRKLSYAMTVFFRRNAGMLVMSDAADRAEKLRLLREWMRDGQIAKALRDAEAETRMAAVFNRLARSGSPGLLYFALKVYHNFIKKQGGRIVFASLL